MTEDQAAQAAPKITCREVAEWTSAYLDEHIQDAEKIRIVLHLVTCAGCRAYVDQMASVQRVLKSLPYPAAEPADLDQLRQAFEARRRKG